MILSFFFILRNFSRGFFFDFLWKKKSRKFFVEYNLSKIEAT